jgi:ParB-like chromosome segregation protein Spo0J
MVNGERHVINGHHRVAAASRAGIDVQYRTLSLAELQDHGYRSVDEVIAAWAERTPDRIRR